MEDFLKQLGITQIPEQTNDGHYQIDIDNSNDFAKIYSKLDKSDLLDEDEESSQVTTETISIQYLNDDYLITLLGDLEGDKYTLTIKPR